MESVPDIERELQSEYLDDNAERFEPNSDVAPVADRAAFRSGIEILAREVGFLRVGFARAEPFLEAGQRFKDWLGQGHAGTMDYLAELGDRHDPGRLLANARSIVVAAAAYPSPAPQAIHDGPLVAAGAPPQAAATSGKVADYALGLDYHIALRSRLRRIGQRLADLSGRAVWTRPSIDTAPLLEREAARRAGIGFIAKSTMLIVPGVGPRVLLAMLVTDLALEPDEPTPSRCGRCTACLDACPTKAFVGPYQLDARRCISYLTIEHQGTIEPRLRGSMGNHLFGCDVCQSVCPYDRVDEAAVMPTDAAPHPLRKAPDLVRWLEMTSTDYRRITKRSALRRVDRTQLMRNAAIVLGNCGGATALDPLIRTLESNAAPAVRAHAAWAIGRIGGKRASQALEAQLARDPDEAVCREIAAALGLTSVDLTSEDLTSEDLTSEDLASEDLTPEDLIQKI